MAKAGFEKASAIQEMTIGPILSGQDIFAQAETGSGKTGAFAIPILEQILRDDSIDDVPAHETRYVVLSPTRELAQQTFKVFQNFGKELGIKSCCVIGGENIDKQKQQIDKGVHVLVATPGRMVDLLKQKIVGIKHCKAIVFDEADRLFEMGFKSDIEFILKGTPKDRQIIMVSATNNQEVLSTAYKYNSNPEELKLNEDSLLVDNIDHQLAMISKDEKFPLLVTLLRKYHGGPGIVFCNTQFQTHLVAQWLINMNLKAKAISGRLAQNKRTRLMQDFRAGKIEILVCTDVAARGLDIKDVNLVVNYDLPVEAANYVHRIGRTGRAGKDGKAISFCAHEDCEFLDSIYELIESKIPKMDLNDEDFAKDICPKPYIDKKSLKEVERNPKTKPEKKVNTKNRTNRENTKKHMNNSSKDKKETEMKAQINTPEVVTRPKIDRRFFEITTYNENTAKHQAMEFFRIYDESLIGHDLVKKGPRKFIIFGARENQYKFFIKPIYKKLLLPFLIEMINKMGLDLFVKVAFKPTNLYVNFSGKDEKMLAENSFELLNAFEYLIKNFLQSKVVLHQDLKIHVKCSKGKAQNKNNDEHKLQKLARSMRKKVLETKKPVALKPMNANERRIIHQFFQDDKQVETLSVGEGRLKKVELRPV